MCAVSPEEEAFTRDVLDQLHTEKFLPCAAFEEGAKQCRVVTVDKSFLIEFYKDFQKRCFRY